LVEFAQSGSESLSVTDGMGLLAHFWEFGDGVIVCWISERLELMSQLIFDVKSWPERVTGIM